jgi:hypothetical protein
MEILNCKTQKKYAQRREKLQLQNRISAPKQKKQNTILKHFFKEILKGKSPAPKLRKSADKSLSPAFSPTKPHATSKQPLQ